jgi:hypothetical protein
MTEWLWAKEEHFSITYILVIWNYQLRADGDLFLADLAQDHLFPYHQLMINKKD